MHRNRRRDATSLKARVGGAKVYEHKESHQIFHTDILYKKNITATAHAKR